jgi:membrane-associated phospholipid phosphatase
MSVDALLDWGIDVVLWFQQASPGLDGLFKFFTFLGDEEFFLILLPFVYWSVNRALGVRLIVLTLFSSLVNATAKTIGGQPRPFAYDDRVVALVDAGGHGLPSGHTQSSIVIWGFLAVEARRRWFWFLAIVLMLGTSLSRIYLGVHFPTDIIGGAVLGIALLILWSKYGRRVERWFCSLAIPRQLALTAIAPLLVMAFMPSEDVVTAAATFLGLGTGIILERRYLHFSTDGSIPTRASRFLLGGLILVGLWLGLRTAFSDQDPELLLRLIRYTLVGLWGSLGAPWLFLKVGLARQEAPAGGEHLQH